MDRRIILKWILQQTEYYSVGYTHLGTGTGDKDEYNNIPLNSTKDEEFLDLMNDY
jgi:hypothetical protein